MEPQIAIRLSGVKKRYSLGSIGGGTLSADLQSWWARLRKREDPNSKLGAAPCPESRSFLALDGIDLTVHKGEALGIIGRNGAGKSTMLKLLSRVTAPTEGQIDIYGRVASMLEVGTGFHGEMTGRENVYMNGAILGMTRGEIDEKMADIIAFSEVGPFIDTPVKRYSSGMYVKLAFSVAAHLDSEIMIMDEVLAVGDIGFQKKCLDKMGDAARKEGRTVLYVSHNMNTIRRLCDRCVVMDRGRIVFDGDPEEAISRYTAEAKSLTPERCFAGAHKGFSMDGRIHIDRLRILGKTLPVYGSGEPVRVRVEYTAAGVLPDLAMRVTVLADDNTVVGLATSRPCVHALAGKNQCSLTLRTDWLAPGRYALRLTAYSVNAYGVNQTHDVVDGAFAFEKLQGEENNGMNWSHTWWGYMMFPELEVGGQAGA